MTDVDEHLLTAAKLREQARGRMDGDDALLPHAGAISDPDDRATLSFLETGDDLLGDSKLGRVMASTFYTDEATKALHTGNGSALSHFVGVTEQDLDASSITLPARISRQLENKGATAFVSACGNPNTGKTNTVSLLAELWKVHNPKGIVISNIRTWDLADYTATSMHDLMVTALEHRETPKFVVVDEGSTHFDARTNSYEVAAQWTPAAKRFAKIGIEVAAIVGHTGKDLHPEAKRLTTLALWKAEQTVVEFFGSWPAESDRPTNPLFAGSLDNLEATAASYSPDDAAPWAWNLEAELFSLDLDWPDLLNELRQRGPAE